jgi:hypothetical protein
MRGTGRGRVAFGFLLLKYWVGMGDALGTPIFIMMEI